MNLKFMLVIKKKTKKQMNICKANKPGIKGMRGQVKHVLGIGLILSINILHETISRDYAGK